MDADSKARDRRASLTQSQLTVDGQQGDVVDRLAEHGRRPDETAGRLDHVPRPDLGGHPSRPVRATEPPSALVRIAVREVERVLSHDDAEVLLSLGDKAIGESTLRTAQRGLLAALRRW